MIGFRSWTTSPSRVTSSRSTPCVAGWCGPMLIVKSSESRSSSVPYTGAWPWPRPSIVIDFSRSRYGTASGFLPSWLLIPARTVVLVEGEDHRLPADREVPALRVPLVVLRHEDPAHVGVPIEDDAK